eukprot:1892762-Amphidinium_carterae.1
MIGVNTSKQQMLASGLDAISSLSCHAGWNRSGAGVADIENLPKLETTMRHVWKTKSVYVSADPSGAGQATVVLLLGRSHMCVMTTTA